jgi:hypothetical protein
MVDREALSTLGWDVSWQVEAVKSEFLYAAAQYGRPSAVYKPSIYQDGNMWCALLGDDLQVGIVGWGETPNLAADAFDAAWNAKSGVVIQGQGEIRRATA